MAMLWPDGETVTAEAIRSETISVIQAVILKTPFAAERPRSAAARPEFGFISLKG
jgi:hypothetical protein